MTCVHTTFAQKHLLMVTFAQTTFAPIDVYPKRHLPRRHLPRRHLQIKTFANKYLRHILGGGPGIHARDLQRRDDGGGGGPRNTCPGSSPHLRRRTRDPYPGSPTCSVIAEGANKLMSTDGWSHLGWKERSRSQWWRKRNVRLTK
jgi:hypothetical protein